SFPTRRSSDLGQVFFSDEAALLLASTCKFFCDIAFIEPVIGSVDGLLSALSFFQCLLLGVHHLLQSLEKIGLHEYLTRTWRFPFFTKVWQEHSLRVWPFFNSRFAAFDAVCQLSFNGISFGQFHRGGKNIFETQRSELCKHCAQSPRRARCYRCEWSVFRRKVHALAPVKFGCGARGCDAQCIDRDNLPGLWIVDQCLRFTAPGQGIPHRASSSQHSTGCVNCISTFVEHCCSRCCRKRFASNCHPVSTM